VARATPPPAPPVFTAPAPFFGASKRHQHIAFHARRRFQSNNSLQFHPANRRHLGRGAPLPGGAIFAARDERSSARTLCPSTQKTRMIWFFADLVIVFRGGWAENFTSFSCDPRLLLRCSCAFLFGLIKVFGRNSVILQTGGSARRRNFHQIQALFLGHAKWPQTAAITPSWPAPLHHKLWTSPRPRIRSLMRIPVGLSKIPLSR